MEYDIIVPTIGNDRVKQIFRVSKGDKNMLPISDILIRSISGYVFIVPVFILYFLYLKKSGRKQSLLHITAVFLFYYYLFGIFDRNRYWLYKHNIISSEDFSDSVSRYDKWTNRYHTECCFICSFWIFSAVAV